uniref:Uncharacterized protein n=1 Tax=Physcomitrium patens TaxID=3218 RepID=A0A2K1L1A2_PHYPA|nr:hypothetical protein PHYPA_002601 [Physcomitrium patens]
MLKKPTIHYKFRNLIFKYVELLDVEYFKDLNLCHIIKYYSQTNFNFKDTKLMNEFNF